MNTFDKQKNYDNDISKHSHDLSDLEIKRIKESILRTESEKFHLFCRMMRIQRMLSLAEVTDKK